VLAVADHCFGPIRLLDARAALLGLPAPWLMIGGSEVEGRYRRSGPDPVAEAVQVLKRQLLRRSRKVV